MNTTQFICAFIVCSCVLLEYANASAIPVWEFLSKEEKMSFLYSVFANFVEDFCEGSSLQNCSQQLLQYGLNSLKNVNDDGLDAMDPYQKDSHQIIWGDLLRGHALAKAPLKEKFASTTPTPPNSYDDDETIKDFGSEGAASTDLDNVYRLPPPEGFKAEKETPEGDYPHNVAELIEAASEDDREFRREYSDGSQPLTGPVVTKLYPDGTPVEEAVSEHLDEDLRQHLLAQIPIPESI